VLWVIFSAVGSTWLPIGTDPQPLWIRIDRNQSAVAAAREKRGSADRPTVGLATQSQDLISGVLLKLALSKKGKSI